MKKLVCELCGSTDLIKKDGVYVCESCGSKFTVEEARKMMVEGTVSVKGTVQVDDTNRLQNYFVQAEAALETGDKEKASNYCDKILENNVCYAKAWYLKGKIEIEKIYFKKAIEYAAQSSEENKTDMEKDIGQWLTGYIVNSFSSNWKLEYLLQSVILLDVYKDLIPEQYINIQKIKSVVTDYLHDDFYIDLYVSDGRGSNFTNYSESKHLDEIITLYSTLEKYGLLTQEGIDAYTLEICKRILDTLPSVEKKFIQVRYNHNGNCTEADKNFYKNVWEYMQYLFDFIYDKSSIPELKEAFNEMEKRLPYFLSIEWKSGRDEYSFSESYKTTMYEKLEKYRKSIVLLPSEDIVGEVTLNDEVTEENMWEYICPKCKHNFSYAKSSEVYDDEKGNIVCPLCGYMISDLDTVTDKKENSDKENSLNNGESSKNPSDEISPILALTIFWIVAEVVLFFLLIDGSFLGSDSSATSHNSYYDNHNYGASVNTSSYSKNEETLSIVMDKTAYQLNEKVVMHIKWQGNSSSDDSCNSLRSVLLPQLEVQLTNNNMKLISEKCEQFDIKGITLDYTINLLANDVGIYMIAPIKYRKVMTYTHTFSIFDENVIEEAIRKVDLKKLNELMTLYDISVNDIASRKIDSQNSIFYMLKNKPEYTSDIIRYITDVNMTDDAGTSLLILAIVRKNNVLLDYLLTKNVNVNYIDKKGRTPLIYAAIKGNIEAVRKLLDHKANLYLSKDGQWTAYKYAKEFNHPQTAKLLKPAYDELIFFEHSCSSCQNKKNKFKEYVRDYPSLKIKYESVNNIKKYMTNRIEAYPVVMLQNSKSEKGVFQEGWNGMRDSLNSLLSK